MKKIIFVLFAILLFFVPIVLWPFTSEVFEFNKMVLVYAGTIIISGLWIVRMVVERKIIFRRTILDIPLLVFLGSQVISTLLSIDFYTSVFGYYSRFNGGLLSTVCYLVLYWGFVSNFDISEALGLIKITFASAVIVSVYGVLEHFGIDKNLWVQDVQSRVFSSLGQPNWLAAWLVALIPLAWAFALRSKIKSFRFWGYFAVSLLFFWTLIFTKSRSGFLGFGIAIIIFWGGVIWVNIKKLPSVIYPVLLTGLAFAGVCLISGTQWTPSLYSVINPAKTQAAPTAQGTALETGGTESGAIREIVWKGATEIWLHYPIFGTGVETFAYSYYLYRPAAHNLTSEWDFIYNKAHNEFLNFAANTGSTGLIAYLILIGFTVYLMLQKRNENFNLRLALTAGFISLSASNFFGFSVVPTQLEFFLFPAIAFSLGVASEKVAHVVPGTLNITQKIFAGMAVLSVFYLLFLTYNYWYADILYSKAKAENSVSRPDLAFPFLTQAISLEPDQAIYYGELAGSYSTIAMAYNASKDATSASQFSSLAQDKIQKAIEISPANINLRRQIFGVYVRLSTIDEKYLVSARDSLTETIKMAPTDPKLYYNLGIADANLGDVNNALNDFQRAIELKANYADARVEYAALLAHLNQTEAAKKQLNYVLTQIDPGNLTAKQALDNLR